MYRKFGRKIACMAADGGGGRENAGIRIIRVRLALKNRQNDKDILKNSLCWARNCLQMLWPVHGDPLGKTLQKAKISTTCLKTVR